MEQSKPNATKIATKWALIGLVTAVILTYALQYLTSDPNSPSKYLGYVPFIAFLLLTQKEYKDQLGGYMTFGEGFSAALRYSIFAGLLLGIFTYIYLVVLSPEVFAKAMEQAQTQMEAKNMSAEDTEKAMGYARKIGPPIAAFGVAIVDAIIGIVVGLIGAAVFKKERTAFNTPDISSDTAE